MLLDAALYGTPLPFIGAAECAQLLPELKAADETRISMAAEDHVLADVDTFADWLSGHCIGAQVEQCRIVHVPRGDAALGAFVETLTVPQLVALQMYPRPEIAGKACCELRRRYLADPQTVCYLQRIAAEVAADLSE